MNIEQYNNKVFSRCSAIAIFVSVILVAFNILTNQYNLIPIYLSIELISIILIILNKKLSISPVVCYYILMLSIVFASCYKKMFVSIDKPVVLFMLIILLMPLLPVVELKYNVVISIFSCWLYMISSALAPNNTNAIFYDITYTLIFNGVGFTLGFLLQKNLEENFKEIEIGYKDRFIDSLTGLLNRKAFDSAALQVNTNNNSFIMIDVDNFKKWNDKNGHQSGDIVLKSVGDILSKLQKEVDVTFYRYGGEEFCGILNCSNVEDTRKFLEMVCDLIVNMIGDNTIVTVSVGCAECDGSTIESLVYKADLALYNAKSNGKNRYSIYNSFMKKEF